MPRWASATRGAAIRAASASLGSTKKSALSRRNSSIRRVSASKAARRSARLRRIGGIAHLLPFTWPRRHHRPTRQSGRAEVGETLELQTIHAAHPFVIPRAILSRAEPFPGRPGLSSGYRGDRSHGRPTQARAASWPETRRCRTGGTRPPSGSPSLVSRPSECVASGSGALDGERAVGSLPVGHSVSRATGKRPECAAAEPAWARRCPATRRAGHRASGARDRPGCRCSPPEPLHWSGLSFFLAAFVAVDWIARLGVQGAASGRWWR